METKNIETSETEIYFLLKQVKSLLSKKTLLKNKEFLNLCNSILCISNKGHDKYNTNLCHDIHIILYNQGLYKGL